MKQNYLSNKKCYYIAIAICVLSGFLFLLFFSRTTSPIYKANGADSYTLILIGRELLRGGLPYVTLTDNKGPLIWYIEALAQLFLPGKNGVFLLQIIWMTINTILIFKIAILILNKSSLTNRIIKYIIATFTVLLFLCSLIIWYEYGNLTEEYSMLFVIASLYILYCKILNQETTVSPYIWIILGACLGAVFMIRMNDCLSIIFICLMCILSVFKSEESNIFRRAGYVFIGFIGVSLLCILQYIITGNFKELLYDYLCVSNEFIKSSGNNFIGARIELIKNTAFGVLERRVCILNIIISAAICIRLFLRKIIFQNDIEQGSIIWALTVGFLPVCFMVSSVVKARGFLHYGMFMAIAVCIGVLNAIVLLIETILDFRTLSLRRQWITWFFEVFLVIVVLFTTYQKSQYLSIQLYNTINYYIEVYYSKPDEKNLRDMVELGGYIYENRDDVTGLGVAPDWYYNTDTMTRYKYLFPLALIQTSNSMKEKFDDFLVNKSPRWIVIYNSIEDQALVMDNEERYFITTNYELVASNDYGELYRLK